MSSHSSGSGSRPAAVALCGLLLAVAIAVLATASAQAAQFKMVLCAANNGSNSFDVATNTRSPQNPNGIFAVENHCGPAPDPAGNAAFLRIYETQDAGNAGESAYASASWTVPPWVAILGAGGYTREPGAFNAGWRARFWAEDFGGGGSHILLQGTNSPNTGFEWSPTSTFAPHLWPFGGFGYFRRFIVELTCMRPAGCDRSGWNAYDANTLTLVNADVSPASAHLDGGSDPLLSGAWVRGAHPVAYSIFDQGSGLRIARLGVDGSERQVQDFAGRCDRDSSQVSGEFARSFEPCPQGSQSFAYNLDTASLADGSHTVSICAQDYAQWWGDREGRSDRSCDERTIHTDNTPPGAPVGLAVTSANPHRYFDHFGAEFALPQNSGSPIAKVHFDVIDAAGAVVAPEQVVSPSNPTGLQGIVGPARAGDYRLRVWLEDEVGFTGPAAVAQIPHDTTPPAAPQGLSVATPQTSRTAEGFDVSWRNLTDDGSPIDAVHYQVIDAAGKLIGGTHDLPGDGIQSITDLDAPKAAGEATLSLWLSDAEGNVGAPVSAALTYDCIRSDVSGGKSLSAGFGGGDGSALVAEGQGAILGGQLQGADRLGASICVFSRVVTEKGRDFLGIAIAGQGGNYRFAVPPGPSRELLTAYRPDQREVSATTMLRTSVHPTFGLRRKVIHNKGFGVFVGSIPGPDNDGVIVVLQVKDGRNWRAFRRYRTREDGKFTLRYRFRHTTTPTTFLTRAQVRQQDAYPYEAGNSDQVGLRVLP